MTIFSNSVNFCFLDYLAKWLKHKLWEETIQFLTEDILIYVRILDIGGLLLVEIAMPEIFQIKCVASWGMDLMKVG